MKAIQTQYKGYRFRSRLEARWAVYFDSLGLDWEYEPEGYHLPSGKMYLPDFRINNFDSLIEIKPLNGARADVHSDLLGLVEIGACKKFKAWGFFGDPCKHHWLLPTGTKSEEWANMTSICFEKKENEEFEYFPTFHMGLNIPRVGCIDSQISDLEHKIKARSARFEHGEKG